MLPKVEPARRTTAPDSRAHAVFFRRRHQPRRPPPAKRRPGRPAPAIGPGTGTFSDINAVPFAESFFGQPAKCDVAHTSLLIGRSTLLFVDSTANAVVRRSSESAPLTRGFFAPHALFLSVSGRGLGHNARWVWRVMP